MQTLCTTGYLISLQDQKALDCFLLQTPKQWTQSVLDGMINKAIKNILRDYLDLYVSQQTGNIDTSYPVIIPAIIAMPEFKPYNVECPQSVTINRTNAVNTQVWEGGFSVEDWQKQALDAYYSNPEAQLKWFMDNKIYQRRKRFAQDFRKKCIADQIVFPANEDDFIDFIDAQVWYQTRAESEQEI